MSHRGQLSCLNQPVAYHSHTLTPSSHSPSGRMPGLSHRTSSHDSNPDGIRKRVGKACDRCRLKKSKCDGTVPCSRCKQDNALCVFGERKKSHDKVYPKGYVEMLEDQQNKLIQGLQKTYRRLLAGEGWEGSPLAETNGNPLTHDILCALDLLEHRSSSSGNAFEDDPEKLQERLIANGAGYAMPNQSRRESYGRDSNSPGASDRSPRGHPYAQSNGVAASSQSSLFKESYSVKAESTSTPPTTNSPASIQTRSYPPSQNSPLQNSSPLVNQNQVWSTDYSVQEPINNNFRNTMRSDYAAQTTTMSQSLGTVVDMNNDYWSTASAHYSDPNMLSYSGHFTGYLSSAPQLQNETFGVMYAPNAELEMDQLFSGNCIE